MRGGWKMRREGGRKGQGSGGLREREQGRRTRKQLNL